MGELKPLIDNHHLGLKCSVCKRCGPEASFFPSAVRSRVHRCKSCSAKRHRACYKNDIETNRLARVRGPNGRLGKALAHRLLLLFGHRSALSGATVGLTVRKWNLEDDECSNYLILLTRTEGYLHDKLGGSGGYPKPFRMHIAKILGGEKCMLPPLMPAKTQTTTTQLCGNKAISAWKHNLIMWWCTHLNTPPPFKVAKNDQHGQHYRHKCLRPNSRMHTMQ